MNWPGCLLLKPNHALWSRSGSHPQPSQALRCCPVLFLPHLVPLGGKLQSLKCHLVWSLYWIALLNPDFITHLIVKGGVSSKPTDGEYLDVNITSFSSFIHSDNVENIDPMGLQQTNLSGELCASFPHFYTNHLFYQPSSCIAVKVIITVRSSASSLILFIYLLPWQAMCKERTSPMKSSVAGIKPMLHERSTDYTLFQAKS